MANNQNHKEPKIVHMARSLWLLALSRFSLPVIVFLITVCMGFGNYYLDSLNKNLSNFTADLRTMAQEQGNMRVEVAKMGETMRGLSWRQDRMEGSLDKVLDGKKK